MTTTPTLLIEHVPAAAMNKYLYINQAFDTFDNSLHAKLQVDCTAGGAVAVSATDLRAYGYLELTGTPAAGFNLDLGAVNRSFLVLNSSGRTATLRAGTFTTTQALANGDSGLYRIDTDHVRALSNSGGAYTDEEAQDAISALLAAGTQTGIAATYDDTANTLSLEVIGNTDYQESVEIIATTDITLNGEQTIQGIALVDGDRVAALGQTFAPDRRIWIVRAGIDWDIADGWDVADTITTNALVTADQGTNAGITYRLSTAGTIVLGTTNLTWVPTTPAVGQFTGQNINDASYTLLTSTRNKWIYLGRAGNQAITLEDYSVQPMAVGSQFVLQMYGGSGTKTITAVGTVTLNGSLGGSVTLDASIDAYLFKQKAKNIWVAIPQKASGFTQEQIEDFAAAMITGGKYVGVTPAYDDTGNVLSLVANHRFLKQPNVPKRNFVNGIPWVSRSSAADNAWRGVAWSPELGLFVAVGDSGTGNRVMTSPDGITWTIRTSAADNAWQGVAWSSGLRLFVAVGSSGTGNRVMTSPDGITWTIRTSAADNDWYAVVWSPELGLFAAVGSTGTGNRVMTSPDGITWTSRSSATNSAWRSLTWSPSLRLFVAVAVNGTGNRVMTSPDGITWTSRSSAADNAWRGVAWSPELGLFVAVGDSGTGNRVMTSPDGITWTTRTSAADNGWYGVDWSPELGLFVAVGINGTGNRVMTSPDGITWTTRTSAADNAWRGVVWSPELEMFVAVGSSGAGNRVMTSMSARYYGQDVEAYAVAASDETTALTTGTSKVTFRIHVNFRCTEVYASLSTAQTSGSLLTVDVNVEGASILSTKLTFDNAEKTTRTAVTPPVLSSNRIPAGSEVTVDIDTVGDGSAKGLKVYLVGFGFK